jgi:hypothetical protein
MEQESERIERHIENKRDDLTRNLEEIESRVRDTLDWRSHYDRNPWLFLGVALAGSTAISAYMASRTNSGGYARSGTYTPPGASNHLGKVWDSVQAALLALAAKRVESFVEEIVPGFRHEVRARM